MEKVKIVEIENISDLNDTSYFEIIKHKLKSKSIYIIYILFCIILASIQIIGYYVLVRLKKMKNFHSKHSYYFEDDIFQNTSEIVNIIHNQSLTKSEKLMKMVNYDQMYEKATRCFTDDPDKRLCLYQYLFPKKVVGENLCLYGPNSDGGYVLLDNLENIKIAYSIGIDHDVRFDKVLADRNIDIYMYDHTISVLPKKHKNFHWTKIGISGKRNKEKSTKTLEEMLKENGHLNEKNMILKLDVEYAEWQALLDTPEYIFKKFKYMAIEFHFEEELKLYFKVLKKLYKTHQVIYLICNNYLPIISKLINNIICKTIEVSYVIREGHEFYTDNTTYPIPEIKFKNYGMRPHPFYLNIIKLFDN